MMPLMDNDPNHKSVGAKLGATVRQLRRQRGIKSQTALSEMLSDWGVRLDQSTISNLELGKRHTIGVDEWLALSLALKVPPVSLLVGAMNHEVIDVSEGQPMMATHLYQWLIGVVGPIRPDGGSYNDQDMIDGSHALSRQYRAWIRRRVLLDEYIRQWRDVAHLEHLQKLYQEAEDGSAWTEAPPPTNVELHGAVEQRRCTGKLFLNACLDAVTEGLESTGLGHELVNDLRADSRHPEGLRDFMAMYGIALWERPTGE